MSIADVAIRRLQALILDANGLRIGNDRGQLRSEEHRQRCSGWMASAENLVVLLCPNPESAYRRRIDQILSHGADWTAHNYVGELAAVLTSLAADAKEGLVTSIENRARAETFDNFLDHAEAYCQDNRKYESGAIAGVVFEDAVRRVCRNRAINEKGIRLEDLISALARTDVLSATKAKRARVAAHVRTKATHAQWDEFDIKDVRATIDFTRELIAAELDL